MMELPGVLKDEIRNSRQDRFGAFALPTAEI
jgi:hypothetical protein